MTFNRLREYQQKLFFVGLVILALTIMLVANLGVVQVPWEQSLKIILNRLPVVKQLISMGDIDQTAQIIILNLRLPRVLLAALVGAGLAVTGAVFQGIFKNPLADPYVLGLSSGAALGAALTMTWGTTNLSSGWGLVTVNAFIGAIGTGWLVYSIARIGHRISGVTLLLTGTAVNILLTALISLIMTFKREQIERIVMWTMGSVATADWNEVRMLLLIVLSGAGIIYFFAKDLNMMLLGDESAKSMGVEVEKVKKYLLLVGTLIVAMVVSVSGVIGFVGLIVPHIIRLLFGPDHRGVIPFSALGGALLMVVCDAIARTIAAPNEIPIGIITSICGVPFFLILIHQNKKKVF